MGVDDGIARMGEIVYTSQKLTLLKALGLGSCIGLCVFDSVAKLGAIAHIMLPKARDPNTPDLGKYADTAVPKLIDEMVKRGARRSRLKAAITGGAQIFSFSGTENKLDVGKRNTEAVKIALKKEKLSLVAEDVGGKTGRTVILDSADGKVSVRLVGGTDKALVILS